MVCEDCDAPGYARQYLGAIILCWSCYEKRLKLEKESDE